MEATKVKDVEVQVTVKVSPERISNLLCSAFEGGTGYWCCITGYGYPEGKSRKDYEFPHIEVVLDGGTMTLQNTDEEEDSQEWVLTPEKLASGLRKMAQEYPEHFNNILTENDDAETADVYVQCCLFGETVYG